MIQEDVGKFIRFFKLFSNNGEVIWKNKITKETKKMFIYVMERQPKNNELQTFQCEAEDIGNAIKNNELKTINSFLLISTRDKCRNCFKKLEQKTRESKVTLYTKEGTKYGAHFGKFCRSCNIYEYHGYYSKDGCKFIDAESNDKFLMTSDSTGFEKSFFKEFVWEFVIGKMSFQTKSTIYNRIFQNRKYFFIFV